MAARGRVGIYNPRFPVTLAVMGTKRFRLVLILAGLAPMAMADEPVPTPTPPGATAPAAAPATASSEPTPTPTPVPTLPANITLSNGTVLRNVSAIRWMRESVTLKHTGGADTIYYAYIAEPDRTTVMAVRDDELKKKKAGASKAADNSVKGMVTVATADSGALPLSGVKVYAVRIDGLSRFATDGSMVSLPKPLASTQTGADGSFSLTVPAGEEYFIFAKSAKMIGQTWQYYEWRLPISQVSDRQDVQLTSAGMVPLGEQKGVTFEP
jgi:hypothetical protein